MEYTVFIITHTIMLCCMIVIIYVENTFSAAIGKDASKELDTTGEVLTMDNTNYDEVIISKRVENLAESIFNANFEC